MEPSATLKQQHGDQSVACGTTEPDGADEAAGPYELTAAPGGLSPTRPLVFDKVNRCRYTKISP